MFHITILVYMTHALVKKISRLKNLLDSVIVFEIFWPFPGSSGVAWCAMVGNWIEREKKKQGE